MSSSATSASASSCAPSPATHSVSYRTRAEIPGKFSALPTKIYGMYAPELVGNADEFKLLIED